MCNAGIYQDGDFCSAIEALKIFRDCAYKYPQKTYNLFLNDYDAKKIRIIKEVLGGDYKIKDTNELLEHIVGRLKIGKIPY